MKKQFIPIALLLSLALSLFCGCDPFYGASGSYSFRQEWDNVTKVEICYHDDADILVGSSEVGPLTTLAELSEDQINSLYNDLMGVPAHEVEILSFGLGQLLFVVTYSDGEQELIGLGMSATINADGSFKGYCEYSFADDPQMVKIFANYADPEVLGEYYDDFWRLYNLGA
jgi:hypothetical protein